MSSHQALTWVLITNSNTCKFYDYCKKSHQLKLLREIKHPENLLKDIELTSDKPGRYRANDAGHGAFSQPTDPKEIKIDAFSREIAKTVDHARNTNAFAELIVISPPHMKGLLLHHFNKHVKEMITHNIEKEVLQLTERALVEFLRTHATYTDK